MLDCMGDMMTYHLVFPAPIKNNLSLQDVVIQGGICLHCRVLDHAAR